MPGEWVVTLIGPLRAAVLEAVALAGYAWAFRSAWRQGPDDDLAEHHKDADNEGMSTAKNFKVGDEVVAARHFIDTADRRHLAGQRVGTVTWVDAEFDVVLIDGAVNVREASKWLEIAR